MKKKGLEVEIPGDLAKKIRKYAKEEGFNPSEFVIYILQQIISKLEEEKISKDDEEVGRELREMGYLR